MGANEGEGQEEYRFGRWQFNAETGDLTDGQDSTRLEPQVGKLLAYFLTHQNVLSSRDDLIARVWGGRIVSDDAINRCISILRQTLTPDQKNAYIETVVRRGFISHFPDPALQLDPARGADPEPEAAPGAIPTSSTTARGIAVAMVVLGLFALLGYQWFSPRKPSPPTPVSEQRSDLPMIAVLPLAHSDFAGDGEFFANGVHDDLLTQLAQIESIRVISRTSVMEYRDSDRSIAEIGAELGADAVLEGSVQRVENHFRINVQLIDVKSDTHLWADRYDRELLPAHIFQVQSEIASAIASALQATLSAEDSGQLAELPTENMAAYRAYHEAMAIRDQVSINAPEYLASLERAVALDPGFVRAWAHLVGYLCYQNFNSRDPASIARIEQILDLIKTRAPDSADLRVAQAYYTYYVVKDYERAFDLVRQAQQKLPSDVRVVELRGYIERRLGDFQGRVNSIRLMRQLDPRNPNWTTVLGFNLGITHQYDEALALLRNARFQSRQQSVMASTLSVSEHRDLHRWRDELDAIEAEFGVLSASATWESRIAARDYPGALRVLNRLDSAKSSVDSPSVQLEVEIMPLISQWLLGDNEALQRELGAAQDRLDSVTRDGGNLPNFQPSLLRAFIHAASGDQAQTMRQIRLWRRAVQGDKAEYALQRHFSCRVLGMTAAVPEAVQCLRSGLSEPSLVTPFIELQLPFYDAIRSEPAFVALLAEAN